MCPECGHRMIYNSLLSTPETRNDERKLVYHCMYCYNKTGRQTIVAIQVIVTPDALKLMEVLITKGKKE